MIPYKIPNKHFKLGSKAHIEDFIYGQRMFQLSSETSKFAFWIFWEIKNKLINDNETKTNKLNVLIIGYEFYSEMLINETISLLGEDADLRESLNVNYRYNLIKGTQEPEFIRSTSFFESENFYNDCLIFIVVPIATTLSTSLKIRNFLLNNKLFSGSDIVSLDNRIQTPYLNLILVTGSDLDKSIQFTPESLEYQFNWRSLNSENKLIMVTPIDNNIEDKGIPQKFLAHHKSKWYKSSDCHLCFPSDSRLDEKILLAVDKASINPEYIINIPKRFKRSEYIIKQYEGVFIPSNAYSYVHRGDSSGKHYIHFIEANPFYEKHKLKVNSWLKDVKHNLNYKSENNIVLITPAKQENLYFLNSVNEIVFDKQAKILQYNTEKSFNQNNQLFYEGILESAKYIYFVDDFVQSGNTFLRIFNFVRETGNYIEGLICMLNKTDKYSLATILDNLPNPIISKSSNADKKFYPFYDVNVRAIKKDSCPMCRERELYQKLADESVLDALKISFLKKARKFQVSDVSKSEMDKKSIEKFSKYITLYLAYKDINRVASDFETYSVFLEENSNILSDGYLKFLTRHFINEYLANNDFDLKTLNDYLINNIKTCIKHQVIYDDDSICKSFFDGYIESKMEYIIIKILSQPDFKNYIIVREAIGVEIINKIINIEVEIKLFLSNESWKTANSILKGYYLLRRYKFLLRRSVLLQLNIIFHNETLQFLSEMISTYEGIKTVEGKSIYGKNREKRNQIYQELKTSSGNISSYESLFNFDAVKLYFCEEAIYNTSLFNYYYAGLVKELVHFEPTKVNKLEEILSNFNSSSENLPVQFKRLIQTIEFENTSIITKSFNEILSHTEVDNFKNIVYDLANENVIPFSECAIDLLKELIVIREKKYQKLEHFFDFTGLSSIINLPNDTYSKIQNDHIYILRTLYLQILILTNPKNFTQVISGITKNINRIVCDTTDYSELTDNYFNNNFYGPLKKNALKDESNKFVNQVNTFIRAKNHNNESIDVTDLKLIYKTERTLDEDKFSFDEKSLVYQVFTGICKTNYTRTDVVPENTLVSLKIDSDKKERKIYGYNTGNNLFLKNGNNPTTFLANDTFKSYPENHLIKFDSFLTLFKINKIKLKESKIDIEPQAIFALSSLEKFKTKRLRYLLSLRKPLSNYFDSTFRNNAYHWIIQEEEIKNSYDRDGHSKINYISTAQKLLKFANSSEEKIQSKDFKKNCLYFSGIMISYYRINFNDEEQKYTTDYFNSKTELKIFLKMANFAAKLKYHSDSLEIEDILISEMESKWPLGIDLNCKEISTDKYVEGRIIFELILNMYQHNSIADVDGYFKDLKPTIIINCDDSKCINIVFSHKYVNSTPIDDTIQLYNSNTTKRGSDMITNIIDNNPSLSFDVKKKICDKEIYINFILNKVL